jgi:hypothetical protein
MSRNFSAENEIESAPVDKLLRELRPLVPGRRRVSRLRMLHQLQEGVQVFFGEQQGDKIRRIFENSGAI